MPNGSGPLAVPFLFRSPGVKGRYALGSLGGCLSAPFFLLKLRDDVATLASCDTLLLRVSHVRSPHNMPPSVCTVARFCGSNRR